MFFRLYAIALPLFLVIDMTWIGLVAREFYRKQIGFLTGPNLNWVAAAAFYLLFIAGLVVFVIAPAVEKSSWSHALLFGALFGLVTYATYDLTNLATLAGWPIPITLVDLSWGTVLGALVSTVTCLVALWIGL